MRRYLSVVVFFAVLLALSLSIVGAQDSIPRGGTVVINESPQGNWAAALFNPYSPSPRHGTDNFIYEPLIVFNPVDGGTPTYWLATDAQYSEDLLSLTMPLREGVKWSDGEDFNADDVVFSVNLMQEFPALDTGAIWQVISGIEKVDDYTVKFDLKEVYTQADTVLGAIQPVPEHIWSTIEDPVTYLNETPVGTGPFTEVEDFSESVYSICRNPNYWGTDEAGNQLPYIDCVRYPAYSGNDSVNNALINGDLDWAGNFIPDIQKVFVDKDPENYGFFFWPDGAPPVSIYLNTTKAPFDDLKFRQALSMAIDYDNIVAAVYGDPIYAAPYNPTGLAPVRYGDWLNQAAVDAAGEMGLGKYNPDGAKALLDEAGYAAGGDGIRTLPDGTPIAFTIQTVNGWTDWTNAAQFVAQNLQDIGLNVSIETPEFGAWFSALQGGTYSASMGWSGYNRTPWDYYRNVFDSSLVTQNADGSATVANGTTWARWFSDETDQLLKDFTSTTDDAAQKDIINQLQMTFVQNVPLIPLFTNAQWYEWNEQRFVGFPKPDDYYAQGSPWNLPGSLITVLRLHCRDEASCGQ
jgi:peptide/nickel transport system substrate-binding protein